MPATQDQKEPDSLLKKLVELAQLGQQLGSDTVSLVQAETRLSLQAALHYAITTVACTILCSLFWVGLWATVSIVVFSTSGSLTAGLALFLLAQIAGIGYLLLRLRSLRRKIGFSHSRAVTQTLWARLHQDDAGNKSPVKKHEQAAPNDIATNVASDSEERTQNVSRKAG